MKWHDDNPKRWQEHMIMSAIDQKLSLAPAEEIPWVMESVQRLENKGFIRPTNYWEWTEAGKAEYEAVCEELHIACEAEQP